MHVCTSCLLYVGLKETTLSCLSLQHINTLWASRILAGPILVNLLSTAVDQLGAHRRGLIGSSCLVSKDITSILDKLSIGELHQTRCVVNFL